jgi:hypothetical protein
MISDKNLFLKKHESTSQKEVSKKGNISPMKQPISKKEQKEYAAMLKEKNKVDMIKAKLKDKKIKIDDCQEEIYKLFNKSNNKETELKNYIAELNSKMLNTNVHYDDKIDEMHKSIMLMITDIQDKTKMEINFTKKEMEREVMSKFMDAEQRQQMLMREKIEEQKKVFERMNNTRSEIDKIRKNFETTNEQCESLSKENESLKIVLQSLEEDNASLEKKLKMLKKEYIKIARENKNLFKSEQIENPFDINFDEENDNFTEEEEMDVIDSDKKYKNSDEFKTKKISELSNKDNIMIQDGHNIKGKEFDKILKNLQPPPLNLKENLNKKDSKIIIKKQDNKISKSLIEIKNIPPIIQNTRNNFYSNDKQSPAIEQNFNANMLDGNLFNSIEDYTNNPEILITALKENIKEAKREYKSLNFNYLEEIKQRNEAQQLLQKCIEDLKLEITRTSKDISNFLKSPVIQKNTKNFEELLQAKQTHLTSLENKIRILTFVYDNGFQNTKMKKNKLFSITNVFNKTHGKN